VLLLGGKPDEAGAALEQALDHYERKGNLVSAQRTRTRLAEIHDATPDERPVHIGAARRVTPTDENVLNDEEK
jgi:hypothetical protein